MNCKDCIYFKRCVVLGVELDMNHDKEADKNCRYFKNKSNVVEVLRCKDCKYFIDREGKCYGQDIRSEEGYDCYKDENDFCSYGDRGVKRMNKIKYYFFCIKWLWKNRDWENTRQKFKAMEKEYRRWCNK